MLLPEGVLPESREVLELWGRIRRLGSSMAGGLGVADWYLAAETEGMGAHERAELGRRLELLERWQDANREALQQRRKKGDS